MAVSRCNLLISIFKSHLIKTLLIHAVVLYSCPKLASDCWSCVGLDINFQCAYCSKGSSGSCMLPTLGCTHLVHTPNFEQCGAPSIAEVSLCAHVLIM